MHNSMCVNYLQNVLNSWMSCDCFFNPCLANYPFSLCVSTHSIKACVTCITLHFFKYLSHYLTDFRLIHVLGNHLSKRTISISSAGNFPDRYYTTLFKSQGRNKCSLEPDLLLSHCTVIWWYVQMILSFSQIKTEVM